ncbi:MAG: YIP1 family protein [Pseudomonadota bacterium]
MQAYRHAVAPPATHEPWAEPWARTPLTMNDRLLEAWRDMAVSTRRLLDENPTEGRLLFYLILSDVVFFFSWSLKTLLAPTSAAAAQLPIDIGLWLILAILTRTGALYALATLATAAAQLAGGRGSARDTRAAVFWAALVSAPFGLMASVLAVILSRGEQAVPALQNPVFTLPPYYLGLVPFLWFIAAGLAEAHGFRRPPLVFLALSLGAVALSFWGLYLSER